MRAKLTRNVMFGLLSVFLAAVIAPVRVSAQQQWYPNDYQQYQNQRPEYRREREREWRERQRRREREWREHHRYRDWDRDRDWR